MKRASRRMPWRRMASTPSRMDWTERCRKRALLMNGVWQKRQAERQPRGISKAPERGWGAHDRAQTRQRPRLGGDVGGPRAGGEARLHRAGQHVERVAAGVLVAHHQRGRAGGAHWHLALYRDRHAGSMADPAPRTHGRAAFLFIFITVA